MRTALLDPAVQLSVPFNGAKEVWIGKRGIGAGGTRFPGSGSKVDPFDGTDQALFDAVMTTYKAVPGMIINLHDGGYTSNFAWGTSVAAGVKIIGSSGSARDILITNTTKTGRLISFFGDNCHAEGFSVDCVGLGAVRTVPVAIRGNNGTIRNVHATHPCDGDGEAFALAIYASATSVTGSLIEYCEVSDFIGLSGTMCHLGNDNANPAATNTGIMQNNRVLNCTCNAYGLGAALRCIVRDNYSFNARRGFNRDTGESTANQIIRNHFFQCADAGIILWAAATSAFNDIVSDNVIEMMPSAVSKVAISLKGNLNNNPLGHLDYPTLRNNTILFKTGDQPTCWGIWCQGGVRGLHASGNKGSLILRHQFQGPNDDPPVEIHNNINLEDGSPMYSNAGTASVRVLIHGNIHFPELTRRADLLPSALLDPDVAAMRALVPPGAVLVDASVLALDALAKGLKTDAVWDKLYEVYALAGDFDVMPLKLKHVDNNTILTNVGFETGDYAETGASGGVKGDGLALNRLDTLWNPVEQGASLTDFSLGVYVAGEPVDDVTSTEIGNATDSATDFSRIAWGEAGTKELGSIGGTISAVSGTGVKREGMLIVTCDGDRDQKYYDDGVLIATVAGNSPGAFADISITLCAMHLGSGSVTLPSARYLRFAFIGQGLTQTDVTNITNRVATYQTALTRNV